jgi:hypothetical protein
MDAVGSKTKWRPRRYCLAELEFSAKGKLYVTSYHIPAIRATAIATIGEILKLPAGFDFIGAIFGNRHERATPFVKYGTIY